MRATSQPRREDSDNEWPASVRAATAAICQEAATTCRAELGRGLQALLLTGSLAREEATLFDEAGQLVIAGDADFLIVVRQGVALPAATALATLNGTIADRLSARGLACRLTLAAVHPGYLRRLPPSIFAHELRVHGRVVAGEDRVLSSIPPISPAQIPWEDAWRLLANRLIEQLGAVAEIDEPRPALPRNLHYRTVKLYLDTATSFLVFAGAYAATYRERDEQLRRLAAAGSAPSPFPLDAFAARVTASTRWKLTGKAADGDAGWGRWREAVDYARRLWRWELLQLTGNPSRSADEALLAAWLRHQPIRRRLRGWLHVVRRQGWHRSWRNWSRWLQLAIVGSPRHCLYAAGSALLFRLADGRPPTGAEQTVLRKHLPLARHLNEDPSDWRQLARDTVWNYEQFVVGTRA